MYYYKIKEVKKVVDSDTIDVVIDLGFSIYTTQRIRMKGYDASETYHPKSREEYEKGIKVKGYLAYLLETYQDNLYIKTEKHIGIYGRYLGEIFYKDKNGSYKSINKLVAEYMKEINC